MGINWLITVHSVVVYAYLYSYCTHVILVVLRGLEMRPDLSDDSVHMTFHYINRSMMRYRHTHSQSGLLINRCRYNSWCIGRLARRIHQA